MKIAIIDAEELFATYYDGKLRSQKSTLKVGGILSDILEYSRSKKIEPLVESFRQYHLEDEDQYALLEIDNDIFPDFLEDALTLYGLE